MGGANALIVAALGTDNVSNDVYFFNKSSSARMKRLLSALPGDHIIRIVEPRFSDSSDHNRAVIFPNENRAYKYSLCMSSSGC